MQNQGEPEKVFEIGAEGGGISIFRERSRLGEKFLYYHNEMDMTDEGLDVNQEKEYKDFETPFNEIDERYPSWFSLYFLFVHEDYRELVANKLVDKLNRFCETPHDENNIEEVLNIKLEFGNYPLRNGVQDIEIKFYNGTQVDYEYVSYAAEYYPNSVRSDDMKLCKTIENINWAVYKCRGKIEYSGSTIIIKDKFNQTKYVFSSAKVFITTNPVLSENKGWFYSIK